MICLIYSTHPSIDQARQAADLLLRKKLAACCNILPEAESHYEWEGERAQASEWAMLTKTTRSQAEAAIEAIRSTHPYENPAILQLPVDGGNPGFLTWVEGAVKTTR